MTEITHQSAEITELTAFALQLAQASGEAILPHFRQRLSVDNKVGNGWDPVTEADRAAERTIRATIEKHYPTHGIIGEEYGIKQGSSAYTWVLDPIDGTRAFVVGMPSWGTLIGLYKDGQPFFGLMNQPFVGDLFYGSAQSSYLRHGGVTQQLICAHQKPLAQALAGTTSPDLYDPKSSFDNLRQRVKMMRYGFDCYSFALLASGGLDIAMDPNLQIYDIAALIPIMQGAGAVVGSWTDNDPTQGGNIICASSQSLLDEAIATMIGKS
ncbi:MAG: inositol monophosphatase family protein [Aestuariivirga sp.]